MLTGSQTLTLALAEFGVVNNGGLFPGTTMVFDPQGALESVSAQVPSAVTMGGNNGVMAWGKYSDPIISGQIAHFAAGLPVPSADLSLLAGTTETYRLIGGTTGVTNNLKQTIGTLNSATLTVNFGMSAASSIATAHMHWTINGVPHSTTSLTGNLSQPLQGSCGTNCNVEADLALFGPNASHAGMAYGIFDTNPVFSGMGAAAFNKN